MEKKRRNSWWGGEIIGKNRNNTTGTEIDVLSVALKNRESTAFRPEKRCWRILGRGGSQKSRKSRRGGISTFTEKCKSQVFVGRQAPDGVGGGGKKRTKERRSRKEIFHGKESFVFPWFLDDAREGTTGGSTEGIKKKGTTMASCL